ncbi:ATP-binding protein [Candidatus Woesearchaeota archaeon]|nr:ATP-binding protein [Candidatus Woesearchaeota archaeon]
MFERKAFSTLLEQSKEKKISLVLGARQVGKTTALQWLNAKLSQNNKCLYLDLDILSNYEKVSTFESLINTLKAYGYEEAQKDFFYLFLDEFQKYPQLPKIMKNAFDTCPNLKIYASGSSSLEVKNGVQEFLAGRKRITVMYPLDFEEWVEFTQDKKLALMLENAKKLHGEELNKPLAELRQMIEEFLIFGSYPEVSLKANKEEKIAVLDSIFDLYVKKDLVDFMKIEKILHMKRLIELLAVNHGQKIKYEELAAATSLTYAEIKQYIELLEETYLIRAVRPFYTNKNKELVKIPKIYFIDPGVRNYFTKNFNPLSLRNDGGFLFEGLIISELLKRGWGTLKFWQDKNKHEVDILLEKEGRLIPLEVKFQTKIKGGELISLHEFFKCYPQVKSACLINLGVQKKEKNIHYLLPYSLGLI